MVDNEEKDKFDLGVKRLSDETIPYIRKETQTKTNISIFSSPKNA